jgi:hypothetical protein
VLETEDIEFKLSLELLKVDEFPDEMVSSTCGFVEPIVDETEVGYQDTDQRDHKTRM